MMQVPGNWDTGVFPPNSQSARSRVHSSVTVQARIHLTPGLADVSSKMRSSGRAAAACSLTPRVIGVSWNR